MSIADEIEKLDALRKQGVISDSDFELRKDDLLGTTGVKKARRSEFSSWDKVPIANKWWVHWLATLLIAPLGVLMLVLFKSYRPSKNTVVRVGGVFKFFFGMLVLLVWTGVVANLAGARTTPSSSESLQSEAQRDESKKSIAATSKTKPIVECGSREARSVLNNAVEQNATAGIDNTLRLLDVQEIQEIALSADGQTRKCQAVLFLNSGRQPVTYVLSLSSNKQDLLVEVTPLE